MTVQTVQQIRSGNPTSHLNLIKTNIMHTVTTHNVNLMNMCPEELALAYRISRTLENLKMFQFALATARHSMTEIRYRETFLYELNSHTPFSQAWRDMKKIKGKKPVKLLIRPRSVKPMN